jgi:hypothetical protein
MGYNVSVLSKITEEVYSASTLSQAKQVILEFLEPSKIKDRDKIISEVNKLNNLLKLKIYFTNALLKFEGLGVGNKKNENDL